MYRPSATLTTTESNGTYSQPLPDSTRKIAASGYRGSGKVVDGKIHIYPEMAAAGLWTTPTDLAKFAIEVQLSLAGKSNKVLSMETTAKMVTPFIEDFIGMGFFIEKHGNAVYFGHGAYGVDEAARTYFGKPVGELSVSEAAQLAGLPKAPSKYSPLS